MTVEQRFLSDEYRARGAPRLGVILECVWDPKRCKYRVRPKADMSGLNHNFWVRFPDNMRDGNKEYAVDGLKLVLGNHYQIEGDITVLTPAKRKRGRPRKARSAIQVQEVPTPTLNQTAQTQPQAKLQGKPMAKQEESASTELTESGGRLADIGFGMKQGAMQGAMNGLLDLITDPMMAALAPKIASLGPNAQIAEKGCRLAIQFILALGVAEATELLWGKISGMLPGEKTPESAKRGRVMAVWMRRYAGQRFGQEVVQAALEWLPLVLTMFSQFSNKDFEEAVKDPITEEELAAVSEPVAVPV